MNGTHKHLHTLLRQSKVIGIDGNFELIWIYSYHSIMLEFLSNQAVFGVCTGWLIVEQQEYIQATCQMRKNIGRQSSHLHKYFIVVRN